MLSGDARTLFAAHDSGVPGRFPFRENSVTPGPTPVGVKVGSETHQPRSRLFKSPRHQ